MPIKNEFFGVTKTLKIGQFFCVAEKASRSRSMKVSAKNFIQGTAANRIMDIGGVSEEISVSAPILIGGGSAVDGRVLLNANIANALAAKNATLPILTSAEISVGEESAMVELKFKNDGNPYNAQVFSLSDLDSTNLTGQFSDGTSVFDALNPIINMPTRTAKFYDFRVALAGYIYFVKSARISVEVEVEEFYFLAGNDGSTANAIPVPTGFAYGTGPNQVMDGTTGQNNSVAVGNTGDDNSPAGTAYANNNYDPFDAANVGADNPFNFGTQFPWLGVAGIKISGSGTAAALLQSAGDNGTDYYFQSPGDSFNVSFATGDTELTLQQPGGTAYANSDFSLDVYDAIIGEWTGLFNYPHTTTSIFNLSRSIISKADFKVEAGLMTVDFDFNCWVKDNPNAS